MNYYEHHIRDYDADTAHLSWLEDMAYTRLLRLYYRKEAPIPADIAQACRLVRAHTKAERRAVETVLREFFELRDDGWRHGRCDEEIAAFHEKQLGKEDERENAKERQRRARERRAHLFEALRSHNIVPAWTTTTAELETMLSRVTGGAMSQPVTQSVTSDDTATQTPDSRLQTPEEINTHTADSTGVGGACGVTGGAMSRPVTQGGPPNATQAGLVCKAMKAVGIADVNPGHPELLVLLEAGATQAEFVGAAEEAVRRHKGFAYALGVVKCQRQEAAKVKQSVHHGPLPAADDARARQLETAALMTGRTKTSTTQETIDVAARVIPA